MIVSILPPGHGYDDENYSEIGVNVGTYTRKSKYRDQTLVIGTVPSSNPFTKDYKYVEGCAPKKFGNLIWERKYLKKCIEIIKHSGAKMVEVHDKPSWVGKLTRSLDIPVVLYLHSLPYKVFGSKRVLSRKRLIKKCAAIYCASDYLRQEFMLDIPEVKYGYKVHTVHYPVEIIKEIDYNKKKKIFLFVGRFEKEKGIVPMSDAATFITIPHHTDWYYHAIGDGPLLSTYRDYTEYKHLAGLRSIHTYKCSYTELQQHYAEASILVLPVLWDEPYSKVALDGMNNGCAIVSSCYGAIEELVGNAVSVIDGVQAYTTYKAMSTMIEDPKYLRHMQEVAKERVKIFDVNRLVKKLDMIRDEIIATGTTKSNLEIDF
jgi:glycosyltransferase involved in cell wall biosynthesis